MRKYLFFTLLSILLGSCTYTMKIHSGKMAVERKQYAVALDLLKKEYQKADTRTEKGELAYLLGLSYDALHRGTEASSWYKIAYENSYGIDAMKRYAFALKQTEDYLAAAAIFKELGLEIGSPYEYRKQIRACEVAAEWAAEKHQAYRIEVLDLNTAAAEYAPSLYANHEFIFTSDRTNTTNDEKYNWTGNAFSDFFLYDLKTGQTQAFPQFNTSDNEGTITFSLDQSTAIFTRCSALKETDAYCQLYMSTIGLDGSWSNPTPLSFQEDNVNYMHPSLSSDGKTLFFSADHNDGWGGFDIYSMPYTSSNEWGTPQLLGRSINTEHDEQFPFLDIDTLYFASSGHTGMGGLDIFRSERLQSGNWAPPINLKTPINSGNDDFAFVVDRREDNKPNVSTGFFCSRRGDFGQDDIYQFTEQVLPPEPIDTTPVKFINQLDIYVLEKIYENPSNPNSRILGRRPLEGASLTIQLDDEKRTITIDEDGKVSLRLRDGDYYHFFAHEDGYLNNDAFFNAVDLPRDPKQPNQTYEVELVLDKIFIDQEIVLENIYYDFDEWYIRDDAQPTLNALVNILNKNPDINIEIGSHTDCRGGDPYNQQLSQRRAQSAVDYLIQNSIDTKRLSAKGYGESQPATDCICTRCKEEEHQSNRRTTFKILESNN